MYIRTVLEKIIAIFKSSKNAISYDVLKSHFDTSSVGNVIGINILIEIVSNLD